MNGFFGGGCDCTLWILILLCCCGNCGGNGLGGNCICDILPLLLIMNCCCGNPCK